MEVEPFSLPLSAPLETAAGSIDRREGFLVRVERDGVVGVGEATPLAGWTESLADCRTVLHTVAGGKRSPATLEPSETPAAYHGISLARADLAARNAGRPLAAWLADDPASSVPVNATLGDADREATIEGAREAVAAGFDCLKLKVGTRTLANDLERVGAVEGAVDATIRVDANGAWSRETAARAVDEFASLGVALVEQPLPPRDLEGLAGLRDRGVEVAVDESLRECRLPTVLDAEAADVVVCKPMAHGGLRRTRTLASRARAAGVAPIVTTTVDGVVARTAALHLAASLDIDRACGLATADRLAADLAPDPAPVTDGRMHVPRGAGVGVEGATSR